MKDVKDIFLHNNNNNNNNGVVKKISKKIL